MLNECTTFTKGSGYGLEKIKIRVEPDQLFYDSPPDTHIESCVQDIREKMLDSLRDLTSTHVLCIVVGRVRCAPHIHALWYLRSDVMTLLAGQYGESAAREQLRVITEMFRGLLPAGMGSRPSPLRRH